MAALQTPDWTWPATGPILATNAFHGGSASSAFPPSPQQTARPGDDDDVTDIEEADSDVESFDEVEAEAEQAETTESQRAIPESANPGEVKRPTPGAGSSPKPPTPSPAPSLPPSPSLDVLAEILRKMLKEECTKPRFPLHLLISSPC
jgi:hypothetical protein